MPFSCSVCFETVDERSNEGGSESEKSLRLAPCGHISHRRCLEDWLKRESMCRVCSKRIAIKDVIPIFADINSDIGSGGDGTAQMNTVGNSKTPPKGLRTVPEITCTKPACTDLHMVHSCLLIDFNELLGRQGAQEPKIRSEMADFQKISGDIASLKEKLVRQQEVIKQLQKRTRCTCKDENGWNEGTDDSDSEDDDDDDVGDKDDDETEEEEGNDEGEDNEESEATDNETTNSATQQSDNEDEEDDYVAEIDSSDSSESFGIRTPVRVQHQIHQWRTGNDTIELSSDSD